MPDMDDQAFKDAVNHIFYCFRNIINISFQQRLKGKIVVYKICREAVLYHIVCCAPFCERSKCEIRTGQSHRDRVNKKLNGQECFILLLSKLSIFFPKRKKKKLSREQEKGDI